MLRALPRAIPIGIAGAVVFAASTYLSTPIYTSVVRFTVNTSQPSAGGALATLARESGINVGQSGPEASLDYWQQVVVGRAVRERVLKHGLTVARPSGTQRIDLERWYRVDKLPPDTAREAALTKLAGNLSSGADSRANILSLVASDRDPYVASALATETLDELNAFNTETRQSTARKNRIFIEARVTGANADAIRAQQTLADFYASNRNFQSSPFLLATESRLRRDAENKTQVYQTLFAELEQARIQEARDVPALTVIEGAVPAIRRSSPNRVAALLVGLVGGIALALAWTALKEWQAIVARDAQQRAALAGALSSSALGRRIARRIFGEGPIA